MMPRVAAFPVCRDHPLFWPLEEAPASLRRNPAEEVYWFKWDHSFGGDAVVRIARSGNDVAVTRKHRVNRFGKSRCVSARLSPSDWAALEDAVVGAGFWLLDDQNVFDRLGVIDGADWLIAGHRGGTYHHLRRQSPHGPLYDVGRLMFDLAGLSEAHL